jgi:hypothetical protein
LGDDGPLRKKADILGTRNAFNDLRDQRGLGDRFFNKTLVSKLLRVMDELEVIGDTRTEQDFARFLDTRLSSAAANTRWDIVCDNLNIHLSESVVRRGAGRCRAAGGHGRSCPQSGHRP